MRAAAWRRLTASHHDAPADDRAVGVQVAGAHTLGKIPQKMNISGAFYDISAWLKKKYSSYDMG